MERWIWLEEDEKRKKEKRKRKRKMNGDGGGGVCGVCEWWRSCCDDDDGGVSVMKSGSVDVFCGGCCSGGESGWRRISSSSRLFLRVGWWM